MKVPNRRFAFVSTIAKYHRTTETIVSAATGAPPLVCEASSRNRYRPGGTFARGTWRV